MNIPIFFQGLIVGLSLAMPTGPIGILCIQRTLTQGRLSGFFSGLGAATADVFYACITIFGLNFISDFIIKKHMLIRLIGGLSLVILGTAIFLKKYAETKKNNFEKTNLLRSYSSSFFLTLANPLIILLFAGVISSLGVTLNNSNYFPISIFISGIFCGSALWFLILSISVGTFRSRITTKHLNLINKVSGIIIIAFGIATILSLAFKKNFI